MTFVFLGVLAQTMFQSTASGIISMIEDRQNNFAQALFITPISRYTLLIGKVLGELGVSVVQGTMVILFAL
jgi:ABC-2 type transport system permease protein